MNAPICPECGEAIAEWETTWGTRQAYTSREMWPGEVWMDPGDFVTLERDGTSRTTFSPCGHVLINVDPFDWFRDWLAS